MTATATTRDTRVIENGSRPGACVVAILTDIAALNMITRFACGDATVVASTTATEYSVVITPTDYRKTGSDMTVFTHVSRLDM